MIFLVQMHVLYSILAAVSGLSSLHAAMPHFVILPPPLLTLVIVGHDGTHLRQVCLVSQTTSPKLPDPWIYLMRE